MIMRNLMHKNIGRRILASICIYFDLFFIVAVISYLLLPEGFLKSKNSILNFNTSSDLWMSTLEIFIFNSISVIVFAFASLFAKAERGEYFLSYGYLGLSVQFALNGITLGTWSFTNTTTIAPNFIERITRPFDIMHRAGLWEMMGQLLIVCALATIAIVRIRGKEIVSSKAIKEVCLSKIEVCVIGLGLFLMVIGAIIESNAIINNL